MSNELVQAAKDIFPTFGHWQSFHTLMGLNGSIQEHWITLATDQLRRYFVANPSEEWDFEPFGAQNKDTRWYLREFGPNSLGINFSYFYTLILKHHDSQKWHPLKTTSLLKTSEFQAVQQAFARIDGRFTVFGEYWEQRNFSFGTATDGHFSERELAWFAIHRTDEFVSQAVEKVERFTKSKSVTDLLKKVNALAGEEAERARETG